MMQGQRVTRFEMDEAQAFAEGWDAPPKFSCPEQAEKWMAARDQPRQEYPVGAVVLWMRRVQWPVLLSGLAMPYGNVEYAGKVVQWKANAMLPSPMPGYQLLTVVPNTEDEMELVWVPADEILGLG